MNSRKYSLTLVLKPGLSAEDVKKSQKVVGEAVERYEGKLEKEESLGVKNLAYPIAGATQATFSRFSLSLPTSGVANLRSDLEKSSHYLRVLLVQEGK